MKLKKFRLILLSCVVVTSLLFSGTAYAQGDEELQLPSPGITPDSPFYFLDTWGKRIGLFFTFGDEAKARKALEITEERLAEAHIMAVKNKSKAVKVATNGYNEYVAIAIGKMKEAVKKGISDNISEVVAVATSKHLLVLDRVMDIIPVEAKATITQAKKVSINGQGTALRLLARENARRAIQINLAAAEGRLNRAQVKAEENETDEVEDALDEFGEMNKFGQEISEIARGLSDNRTVDELVALATSHHLEVLAIVYEKVPDQAKPAVEKAMDVSVRGHERAVEVLKERGPLPKGISDNITEGVPDKVKERILRPKVPPAPTPTAGWGIIEIRVTDPPPPGVASANVTLTKIEVHKAVAEQAMEREQSGSDIQTQEQEQQQTQQGEGEWITIIDYEVTFDLFEIIEEADILGSENVTAGKYTQIRMDVIEIAGLTTDNTTYIATVPSGKLKFVKPFEVKDGFTTILTIDFDGDKSLIMTGKGTFMFKPVIKLLVEYEEIQD